MSSSNVVIVDAVRTPIGRRGGGLSSMHPADLLGIVQSALVERVGIDPAEIGQVVGGCVSQVGEQSFNVTRTAWLAAGLPLTTAATTIDTQCGIEPAGDQPGHVARRQRRGRRRRRLRRRVDEPDPDRHQQLQEARPRHPDPEAVLRAATR